MSVIMEITGVHNLNEPYIMNKYDWLIVICKTGKNVGMKKVA